MYGLYWCPHCIDQKVMFGDHFSYVTYVECGINEIKGRDPGVQGGRIEVVPQLAVRRRIPEGRSVVSRSLEPQDGVQPAVRDSAMVPASTLSRVDRILFVAIAVLALAGVIVSAVSLQRHYAKSATEFCDFSQQFSCDIVNRSQYSTIEGIPVAGIGVAGYAALFVLVYVPKISGRNPKPTRGCRDCGIGFCSVPYLYGGLRTDDVVHLVPGFPGAHLCDQRSRDHRESK